MDDWLDRASSKLAAAAGDDPGDYVLSAEERRALLELARVAAHESGDRTNAPLVSFLAGLARGRHPELSVAELVDEATGQR